jgi:hypothetical protein
VDLEKQPGRSFWVPNTRRCGILFEQSRHTFKTRSKQPQPRGMMSTASSSSEWLIVEEWDLVDCESISTCSESFSDFSIISWPGDVEPQIAANVTYLDALTRFTEPAVGKASGEASLAESLAELKRFGESLAIKSIKIHRQPSSTSPENEACFR